MAPAEGHRSSSGRNLPPTAEHQYNVSNKTVNAFLGGRRKSWMTSSAPVKPSPRPANRPPKESLPELPPVRVGSSQQSHHQHQRPSATAVRASNPAPAAAASVGLQLPPRPSPAAAPAQTAPISSAPSAVLPSPAPSDEPSPLVPVSVEASSPTRNRQPAPGNTSSAPVASARLVLTNHIDPVNEEDPEVQSPPQQLSASASANGQAATTTENEAGNSHTSRAPPFTSVKGTPLQTPPTPTSAASQPMTAHLPPSPNGNPERPAKRRRTGNMAQILLAGLKATENICHQIRHSGGDQGLDPNVERPRYQLLRNACAEGDLFFVVLHQLFCSWSYSSNIAHTLCVEQQRDPNRVDDALRLMSTILKSNSKLRPEHARFFRNFPLALEVARSQLPLYQQTISQVLLFLTQLSLAWIDMNGYHRQVGYPFLMDELLGTFGLYSTTLQSIVFRASRRTLGVTDGYIGQSLDELFKQDQQEHIDENGNFFVRAAGNYEEDPYNKALIHLYIPLVEQGRALSSQTSQQTIPDTTHGQQPTQQQQPQHTAPQPNLPLTSATGNAPAMTYTPVPPINGQGVQSPIDLRFASSSPAANGYASAPNAPNHHYQPPPPNLPMPPGSTHVQSPANSHFPGAAPPSQPPLMTQGHYFQVPGRPTGQFAGIANPSPPAPQNYSQHFPRQASQHYQVPNSHSPQMQYSTALPQQARGSPVQNSGTPVQQAQVPGRSSPQLQPPRVQPNGSQVSPHMRLATAPTHFSNAQTLGNGSFEGSPVGGTSSPSVMPMWQQQQQLLDQHTMSLAHQVRQSNVRPQPPASRVFHHTVPSGNGFFDYRRGPSMPIPVTQYPHDPHDRKSLETSLHQAHLRSPKRMLKGIGFSSPPERYYQFVKYLAVQPAPIPQQKHLHLFRFDISEADYHNISRDAVLSELSLPTNLYFNGSLRLRLRVCLAKLTSQSMSEAEWIASDTCWPENIHMQLNQQSLAVKRRQHHAKDQPVELGAFVNYGENLLRVSVPVPHRPLESNGTPFIAVEVIETLSHASIRALPNLAADAVVPASHTRAVIQRRLGGLSDPDNDEIAMVTSDLIINLADPFSYSLWNTPVRGKDCTHLECFDLETWLETRPGKKACTCGAKRSSDCKHCPKEPSVVDKWKCPLCQGDARPYNLCVDGFLSEVRQVLAGQNLLKVKEIKVTADGNWTPTIPDDDDDIDSDEEMNPDGRARRPLVATPAAAGQAPQRHRAPAEVIYLDD